MWQIIKNEWQFLYRTRLFAWVSLGFLGVLAVSFILSKQQNERYHQTYEDARKHLRKQWENLDGMNPHGAAHYGTYVFKPANFLSSLDEGVTSTTGNVLRVEGHVQNEMAHSEASQMQTISKFGKLKSSLLLKYVVPLLLIFLAFNSISNEKRSGRLKLLTVQGANPLMLLLGKCFAIWAYGFALLASVVLFQALFHSQSIHSDAIQRMSLFLMAYALYYFIVTGLTIFFSAKWENATVALTSMLGIWILWTIFLPNIFLSSVEKWHPLPSRNAFKEAMKEDRSKGLDGHNPSDERGKALEVQTLEQYGVETLEELPVNFDGLRMQADEEYGNQVWDKHFGNLKGIIETQKSSLQLGGVLTPFISLQNVSMGFAGNDNLHHQEFLLQVEQYRRVFIKALNDEHAFGGSKTGDWSWEADNDFFRSVSDFEYELMPLGSVMTHYWLDLGILLGWTLLTIGLLMRGAKTFQTI
ncbi:MAG: DUF3526 domain-containing protein [Bacteroidota bacterium]